MTPDEKANELLRSFSFIQYDQEKGVKIKGKNAALLKSYANQCAIIAVNEILQLQIFWVDKSISFEEDESDTIEYWQAVKQSLTNL